MTSDQATTIAEVLEKRRSMLRALRARRKIMAKVVKVRTSRPEFLRNLWWKFSKFQNNLKWKKPRGKDNPMRLSLKGYPPIVRSGYGTPSDFRNLHPTGMRIAVVSNVNDVKKLNPKEHIIYIASTVGLKKRLEILSTAKALGFKVANE